MTPASRYLVLLEGRRKILRTGRLISIVSSVEERIPVEKLGKRTAYCAEVMRTKFGLSSATGLDKDHICELANLPHLIFTR